MRSPIALSLVCLRLVAGCTPNEGIDAARRPATARPIASPPVPPPEPLGGGVRWESRGTPIGFGQGLVVLGQDISVHAFPLHCRWPCEPAFTTGLHTYDPVLVRRDVAYVGTDRGVAILSLGCSGSCYSLPPIRRPSIKQNDEQLEPRRGSDLLDDEAPCLVGGCIARPSRPAPRPQCPSASPSLDWKLTRRSRSFGLSTRVRAPILERRPLLRCPRVAAFSHSLSEFPSRGGRPPPPRANRPPPSRSADNVPCA